MDYTKLLAGKRAVVLNGDDALGQAIVQLFSQQGASVAFGLRDPLASRSFQEDICNSSPESFAHPVDLADAASIEEFCAAIKARWPLVHVLVNNPFSDGPQALEHTTDADDAQLLQIYQHSAVQTFRAFWPAMITTCSGCSIINISSTTVHEPMPGQLMHTMANGTLGGMTRVPAVEGGIHEVRVNEIYAGHTAHRDTQGIARTALFLACDMASYVSGASIRVGAPFSRPL